MNPDYNTAAAPSAPPSESATQPAVAEPRNASVEACREALNTVASVARLFFAEKSFDIAPDRRGALKKIVAILKNCRNVTIEVEGYTDSTGTPTNNKRLSELRAKSVVDFLAAAGIDPSKLKAIGFGQERPITTNSTPEGRRMNRRIEFFISGQ
jgi:outer membrane protein OmpA-like peptidoglycan-associated protein